MTDQERSDLPAASRRLWDELVAHGWDVDAVRSDDGRFSYRYDDGSTRRFGDVPVVRISAVYVDDEDPTNRNVAVAAEWIRNPITGRWVLTNPPAEIGRYRRDDEYPNRITAQLAEALGSDVARWYPDSLAYLRRWIRRGPAVTAKHVAEWDGTLR